MNELSRAWRFLYAELQGGVDLVDGRIYRGAVPQGGAFPAVIYAMISSGTALTALGGARLWVDPIFKVVAAGETGNGLTLEPIADQIDLILHNASGATDAGGYVFSCQYLRPFELMERTGTTTYQQLGGEYGITIRAS